jgi:hypothetical protein
MSVGPFNVTPIQTRVRAQVAAFLTVGQRADLAQLEDLAAIAPAAFVLLGSERGEKRMGASNGLHVQRCTAEIGVLIVAQQYRANEEQPYTDAPQLIEATRTALVGWGASSTQTGLEFVSGRVIDDADGRLLWLDLYRVDYFLEA